MKYLMYSMYRVFTNKNNCKFHHLQAWVYGVFVIIEEAASNCLSRGFEMAGMCDGGTCTVVFATRAERRYGTFPFFQKLALASIHCRH